MKIWIRQTFCAFNTFIEQIFGDDGDDNDDGDGDNDNDGDDNDNAREAICRSVCCISAASSSFEQTEATSICIHSSTPFLMLKYTYVFMYTCTY